MFIIKNVVEAISTIKMLLFITGRNEVVAKVMFLHMSVILYTGGVSREPPGDHADTPRPDRPPPGPRRTPPWRPRKPPRDQGEPPPEQGDPPGPRRSPPGRGLQHTVNERPVRILLECILVTN